MRRPASSWKYFTQICVCVLVKSFGGYFDVRVLRIAESINLNDMYPKFTFLA